MTNQQHTAAAIQYLSSPLQRLIYTHTGWHQINGRWHFLHGASAITATIASCLTSKLSSDGASKLPTTGSASGDKQAVSVYRILGCCPRLSNLATTSGSFSQCAGRVVAGRTICFRRRADGYFQNLSCNTLHSALRPGLDSEQHACLVVIDAKRTGAHGLHC